MGLFGRCSFINNGGGNVVCFVNGFMRNMLMMYEDERYLNFKLIYLDVDVVVGVLLLDIWDVCVVIGVDLVLEIDKFLEVVVELVLVKVVLLVDEIDL